MIGGQLSSKKLIEAVDIALLAGRLMLQYGAETEKVEQSVYNIGYALGCDSLSAVITHNSIILTVASGIEYRTKIVKVVRQGVNYDIVSKVARLSYKAATSTINVQEARDILAKIESEPVNYDKKSMVVMASLACGGFSMIFGGDILTFVFVFFAALVGMTCRFLLIKKQFNALLIPLFSAFVATLAGGVSEFVMDDSHLVYASSVLFLIPGVQLLNSAEDVIKGHFVVGFTRGFMGILISLSIAFGISFGLLLTKGSV